MVDYDFLDNEPTNGPEDATLAVSKPRTKEPEPEGQLTIDVYQTEDDIVVQSTIAGAKSDDIDISITNDMVTIRGRREIEDAIKQSDYYYQEIYWGPFSRSVILPVDIDADNAKASFKNGVLTIRLPRLDKVRTKKVRIAP